MKIFIQLLILLLPLYLMGQDPDLIALEEGVENLNFSEVPSGLLADISPQLINLNLLDGQTIDETNRMTINTYGMAYATIFGAAINDDDLLPPSDGYMAAVENFSYGNTIPITVSAFHYHQMKSTALDDGLFTVSEGKLYDVPNRSESPYEEKTTFFASAITNVSYSPTMSFEIPSDLYLTNFSSGVNGIEINLGDGNGFQTTAFDAPISVDFGDFTGQKEIAIQFTYNDGTVLSAHTILHIVELPEADTGVDFRYDPVPSGCIGVNGGKGFIFSLCGAADSEIRKPFFFVEGFNPDLPNIEGFENQTFRHMRRQLNGDLVVNGVSLRLLDVLEAEGYDLIYVDFADPTASIQDNAAVLTAIINAANTQKASNNSIEENVIFGESMGGLVSKYALLNMENNGIDHETQTLMTFDSPLRGANLPLSMQMLVDDMYTLKIKALFGVLAWSLRDYVPEIRELGDLIRTPAVQQMLINHIFHDVNVNQHKSLMAEIEAFGEPQDFEMFAISNGSVTGVGQLKIDGTPLNPGDKILGIDINAGDISTIVNEFWNLDFGDDPLAQFGETIVGGFASLILKFDKLFPLLLGINLKLKTNLYAMKTFNEKIYDFKMNIRLFGSLAYAKGRNELKADPSRFTLIPLDNAPGGIQGTNPPSGDIFDFAVSNGFVEVNATTFCFIPTVSALDINSPENEDLFQNLLDEQATLDAELTVVDRYIGSPDASVTSFGIVQNNQEHVVFTNINARLFVLGLSSGNALSGLSDLNNRIFNFGESDFTQNLTVPFRKTSNVINYDLSISNNAELWVNRVDKIGFIDNVDNAENKNPSHFDLYVRPDYCDEGDQILIRVGNTGKIILGEWEASTGNTANLFLGNEVTLRVEDNGLLEISNSSKLIIQSGAEVIIESGGLLDCRWNAQVIVEAGGILRVENNGQLRPGFNSQVWVQPGGQLILDNGAKVQLWNGTVQDADCNIKLGGPIIDPDNTPDVAELVIHGAIDFSGTGYFDIHPNSNIELVGDADFKINGYAKGYRFLKLSNAADLVISKNKCQLSNGKVAYSPGSTISLSGTAVGHFTQMEFAGVSGATGITGDKCESIFVSTSDFTNFGRGIYATQLTGTYLGKNVWVYGSEFMDCATAIDAEALDNILVWDTHIATNAPEYSGVGLQLTQVNNAYLTNADIENLDEGVLIWGATDFVMNGGNIHDCRLGINLYDAPSDFLTNSTIDLIGKATLQNNFTGIFGVQSGGLPDNTPFPMITLDCARLIENLVGIRGRDLLLNIDGGSETAPNVFIVKPNFPKSKILELCYYNLEMTSIAATNNYWGTNANIARAIFHSDNLFNFCGMYSSDGPNEIAAPNIGVGNIPLVFEPILAQEPTGCSEPGEPGGPIVTGGDDKIFTPLNPTNDYKNKVAECLDSQQRLIYDNYWRAYGFYLAEAAEETGNHTNSRGVFGAIAQLANDDKGDYSETCRMLIEKARSRAGYIPSRNAVNGDIRKISTGCRDLAFEMNPDLQKLGFRQIQVWYSEVAFEEGIHPKDSQPEAKTLTVSITEKAIQDWSNANFQIVDLNPSTAYFLAYELVGASASSSDIRYFSNPLSTNECPRKFYDDSGVYFDEDCQINGIWWSFEYGKTNGYFEVIETAEFTENPEKLAIKTIQIPNKGESQFSYFIDRENAASGKTQWLYMRLVDQENGATLDWMVWDLSADPCEDGVTGRSNTYLGNFLEKEEYLGNGAMVYPNPVEHLLYLKTVQDRFSEFQIIDVIGTYWLRGNLELDRVETKIDVSLLPPGVYMIQLKSKQMNWKTIRFVVSE